MEHVVTFPAGVAVPSITEVVAEAPAPPVHQEQRNRRILQLREAIQSGAYLVSAPDLADAMLRAVRRAN